MFRKCSGCGLTVSRGDCHKNRYGEYLCRNCQAAGMKFTGAARSRRWRRRAPAIILSSLLAMAVIALVISLLYGAMLGLESLGFFRPPVKR